MSKNVILISIVSSSPHIRLFPIISYLFVRKNIPINIMFLYIRCHTFYKNLFFYQLLYNIGKGAFKLKNYTVMFLLLFVASIAGGMALKNIFEYSMLVGIGLAFIFLLCSAFSLSINNRKNQNTEM